jgi:hypothetical protein
MSMHLILDGLVAAGKLVERPSAFTGFETGRTMYVSPDILNLTTPPFPDTEEGVRLGEFAAWLDAFSEHGQISVSQDPDRKPQDTMLAKVHPIGSEFWSIRVTEPDYTAGIRALGAFAGKDIFVALSWEYRDYIADFDDEVAAARTAWRDLFGSVLPHGGNGLTDYLTNYLEA